MRFYYVNSDNAAPCYARLDEAKRDARYAASTSYHDIAVDLIEVDTDKANILRLINQSGGYQRHIDTVYSAKAGLKGGAR
jgi:hypothetical protein